MTPTQIVQAFLEPARDRNGMVLPLPPELPPALTGKEAFRYGFSLLGIRDPETVEELWREQEAKRPKKAPRKSRRRKR